MCFKSIKNFFCKEKPEIKYIDKPDLFSELSKKAETLDGNQFNVIGWWELKKIITQKLGSNLLSGFSHKDANYITCPIDVLEEYHNIYRKYMLQYKKEVFDCDNYALDYLANLSRFAYNIPNQKYSFAMGITTGDFYWVNEKHAVNIFVDSKKEVHFLEPQTLKIYPIYDSQVSISYI